MAKPVPLVIDEYLLAMVQQYAEVNGLTFDQAVNALASDAAALTRGALRALLNRRPSQLRQVH